MRYVTLSPRTLDFAGGSPHCRAHRISTSTSCGHWPKCTAPTPPTRAGKPRLHFARVILSKSAHNIWRWTPLRAFTGNGASLHAIHWAADLSDKGLQQSVGMMVNYLYDLDSIEENHDAYFDQGEVAISRA